MRSEADSDTKQESTIHLTDAGHANRTAPVTLCGQRYVGPEPTFVIAPHDHATACPTCVSVARAAGDMAGHVALVGLLTRAGELTPDQAGPVDLATRVADARENALARWNSVVESNANLVAKLDAERAQEAAAAGEAAT